MSINMNQEPQNVEFKLNKGDVHHTPLRMGTQIVRRSQRVFKGVYDFAVQGGAISTIALYDPAYGKKIALNLPANFLISNVTVDVITAPTSGGSATLALSSGQTAADFLAATAKASFTGIIQGIPAGAASSSIKVPAAQASPGSPVTLAVAVAALTAGQFVVHIEGFISDLL